MEANRPAVDLGGIHETPLEEMSDSGQTVTVKEDDNDHVVPGPGAVKTGEYEHVFPTGFKLACILAGVTISYYLLFLDLAIISTATPAITSEFNSLMDIGWYAGAYQLASAAFQPLSGKLYTYFPLKACEYRHPQVIRCRRFSWANRRVVVVPRLLLRVRTWVSHLWRSTVVVYVHCWPSHRRSGVLRSIHRLHHYRRERSSSAETTANHGNQYGYWTIGSRMWSNHRRRFHDKSFMEVLLLYQSALGRCRCGLPSLQ